jgi:hypothetical protein
MALSEKNIVQLPPQGAFVVQFCPDTDMAAQHLSGRVEHVVSGRASRFESLEALLDFIARVLRTMAATSQEAACPRPAPGENVAPTEPL